MLGALSIMACGGGQVPKARNPHYLAPPSPPPSASSRAPDWVRAVPSKKGRICAVGGVEPTFYRQDGMVYAAEAARNELARSIQVHIYSVMYDVESARGGSTQQYIVSEVVTAVHDGVLAGAEIVSTWFDEGGAVSKKGMTYALACMDTEQSVAQLAERLEQAFPDEEHKEAIAQVRERAKAAFDELESMEEKKVVQAEASPTSSKPNPTEHVLVPNEQ